ncbi:AIR synthase-related protein [Bdellovibrionota bacterium FG-1]
MYARIEVAMRPEFADPAADAILRKIELAYPEIRRKIRWARLLDVCWLDLPATREELIPAITEVFWDRVLQWLFTGNLIPSAAGKQGGVPDLMEKAPNRPGRFWALERRFRPGVTDNIGRTSMEAFEIVLGRSLNGGRSSSGSLLVVEGQELDEDSLAVIARDIFCNELVETWTIVPEAELKKNDRFHQERIKLDLPKILLKGSDRVETFSLQKLADHELEALSRQKLWALSLEEMKAVRNYFAAPGVQAKRNELGLPSDGPTDVEIEVIAQTWSEHCKHKIFGADVYYSQMGDATDYGAIPEVTHSLFKTTIAATTEELQKPWLLSVFSDNAGIVAFDDEDAFCIKVETHNSPSALDPYGGALTGIVGVNRDILGCGMGAKPIFNTDVFCVAPLDYSETLPDRLMHPRRILDGVRRGVEDGGNKSGIPTVNGALCFDERYLGKPLVYCGTGGFMPRSIAGVLCETKQVRLGDRICMVGGRIGSDGIHGATFSSLAMDERSPSSAVQLGDPITQKRMADFLLEARDMGLFSALTDNGAGGLSSSVGEMARLSGGARMDVSYAKIKYPGLKPYELVISESQERMTVAVSPDKLSLFLALAGRRGVEVSDLGEFTDSGALEVFFGEKRTGYLDLAFLHDGVPKLELRAEWRGRPQPLPPVERPFHEEAPRLLQEMMGRPNIASKEWLIRQFDHEVQGTSVIKPLHTVGSGTSQAASGPNDAAVLKPKPNSDSGLVIGCGINPKLSDYDTYVMAQAVVDESVRNVLCSGADFGRPDSVLAIVDNFCWPDPVNHPQYCADLVRACYGLRDAALALNAPLVSGKDSMKNDFYGHKDGQPVTISVPPTLLVTAIAKVSDVRNGRTSDFKQAGDAIYLFGGSRLGLVGSELEVVLKKRKQGLPSSKARLAEPDWDEARRLYSWIGGASGREQVRLRSLHDVSEGGLLVTMAECLIARGLGAQIQIPADAESWEFGFGEGFHTFIASCPESDAVTLEGEWIACNVPYRRLGAVTTTERLEVEDSTGRRWSVSTKDLRAAWQKEGYWE